MGPAGDAGGCGSCPAALLGHVVVRDGGCCWLAEVVMVCGRLEEPGFAICSDRRAFEVTA
jgi:hypothetical protein